MRGKVPHVADAEEQVLAQPTLTHGAVVRVRAKRVRLLTGRDLFFLQTALETCLNEPVKVSVQDRLGVGGFNARTQILDP